VNTAHQPQFVERRRRFCVTPGVNRWIAVGRSSSSSSSSSYGGVLFNTSSPLQ